MRHAPTSRPFAVFTATFLCIALTACSGGRPARATSDRSIDMTPRLRQYATVRLTADLSGLTHDERRMLPLLIEAAREMDAIYWQEMYPARDSLLATIADSATRRYLEINYGPWDRLAADTPFVPGVGRRPPGAAFYPPDLTADAFTAYVGAHPDRAAALRSLYTVVRRAPDGGLDAIPYHVAFAGPSHRAAGLLRRAAALADDAGLRDYLLARADALDSDNYRPSDIAWMDMKSNTLDIVIGPIETYDDRLFGYKAAHEAFVLIKDLAWSRRLSRYLTSLPELQRGLPVPAAYKREQPGLNSDLNAYDVVFYAGQSNAGAKTIAINLPNDETVQLEKGSRRLQLENAMRAKFDSIAAPIAGVLVAPDQRAHVTWNAFFENTMFHEVAHGLGIKRTIDGKGTVREALRDQYSALEEEKADVLGLYMVRALRDQGVLTDGALADNYVTFLAGILRSVRFGAGDAHGRANMVTFHFFERHGAFARDAASGTYRVDVDRMGEAVRDLGRLILTLQGDGDYNGTAKLYAADGVIDPALQHDLDRLTTAGIPIDIVFDQGESVLGLGDMR